MARTRLILDFLAHGRSHRYGRHSSQRANLYVPAGPGPHPVIVLIHGGSWQKRYGKVFMRWIAGDLLRRGYAVWNIEYRRVGADGGWPATFEDVATAIDHLAVLRDPHLDLARVTFLGHSAGGHLALWAAARPNLPPGAPGALARPARDGSPPNTPPPVRPCRVVSLAGVADLAEAYRRWRGGVVRDLMGGSPAEVPERYAAGDPMRLLPLQIPVLIVHGVHDQTVSIELSRGYAAAARRAGGEVELVEIEGPAGSHRAHLDPRGAAWAAVVERLDDPTAPLPAAARAAQDPDIPSGRQKSGRNEIKSLGREGCADLLGRDGPLLPRARTRPAGTEPYQGEGS
ncbi:MAG TPA: alpha/beta hydrolase [Solirubrobacteraceae bacterium]